MSSISTNVKVDEFTARSELASHIVEAHKYGHVFLGNSYADDAASFHVDNEDPVVVSDGDSSWKAMSGMALLVSANKHFFDSKASRSRPVTVYTLDDFNRADYFKNNLDIHINSYPSLKHGVVSTGATRGNLESIQNWTRSMASMFVFQPIDAESAFQGSQKFSAALLFGAIASDSLIVRGFLAEEVYEDILENQVAEFFRNSERVSLVISDQMIQILTYLNGEFDSKTFETSRNSKVKVAEYFESIFA